MNRAVIEHYDLLIDENNDPVHDPAPLREYMDLWDGPPFISLLRLRPELCVLEIGVGTGRLALRTAPLCHEFWGIDLSPKTVSRARENLEGIQNTTLLCGDFLSWSFGRKFDVIYSSLTFMHIAEKQQAIFKAAELLNTGGRFILSIDKNQNRYLDYGTRRIGVYPDTPEETVQYLRAAGLMITEQLETGHAHIFAAGKS